MMLLDREKDSAVKMTLSGRYRGLGGDTERKEKKKFYFILFILISDL